MILNLSNAINCLISEGARDYDFLQEYEKRALVYYAMGEDEDLTWLHNAETIIAIKRYFLGTCNEGMLAKKIVKIAKEHYEPKIIELFEDRVNQYACELKREAGLKPRLDEINGEIVWRR